MTNRLQFFQTFYFHPTYVAQRDALIPEAEHYANRLIGGKPHMEYEFARSIPGRARLQEWRDEWDRCFFMKMNQLARENGLCGDLL